MRIADHLTKEQKQQMNRMKSTRQKPPKLMNKKDWEELMGKNRDIYVRKNGALRRK
jgi:hypothetical protein